MVGAWIAASISDAEACRPRLFHLSRRHIVRVTAAARAVEAELNVASTSITSRSASAPARISPYHALRAR